MPKAKVLVTGGAGFIGSHLCHQLLQEDWAVDVLDNFDPYYDPEIKRAQIQKLLDQPHFSLSEGDIRDMDALDKLAGDYDVIVHLAAKAGVRPSIVDPRGYQDVNVRGTQNVLEMARKWKVPQFVFASSSSVYGLNPDLPWREESMVLKPISPYASTKVSGELLGHVYSHLFNIRFIALRFFTVYGPGQRPDLAIHNFGRKMMEGKVLPFFGDGSTRRDYTYIADIVQGIMGAMRYEESMYEVINLGNDRTISLSEMVNALEKVLEKTAVLDVLPEMKGDLPHTWADISKARSLLGYAPATSFELGIEAFAHWLRQELRQSNDQKGIS
jgi:UDP-glucuronate 4-epimerase